MATIQRSAVQAAASSATTPRFVSIRASVPSRARASVVVTASKDGAVVSRREAMSAAVALSVAAFSVASPAHALFGIGDDNQIQETYSKDTAEVLAKVNAVLALPRDDPTKDDAIKDLRKYINSWVAAYRREPRVSGRPSFGNTYSALNALAGHYNNFGTKAPVPKKRLERLVKELDDANLFLSRNR